MAALRQLLFEEACRLEQTNALVARAEQFLREQRILQPSKDGPSPLQSLNHPPRQASPTSLLQFMEKLELIQATGPLAYIPGTLTAGLGMIDDSRAPALYWSGMPVGGPEVSITFAVTVTESTPAMIVNTDVFRAGEVTATPTATIVANRQSLYLPVALKP